VPRDDASKDALVDYISKLKHEVSTLVYENNRYHLAISNCTMCTSDDEFSNASLPDEVSMIISTPVTASLDTLEPSTSPVPCPGVPSSVDPDLSRTSTPPLLSRSVEKKLGDSKKSKDRNFILRMVRTLTKLETKYQVPKHKRKKRLFTRKQRSSPVVPRELASIYYVLAAPEPEAAFVPYPFPDVRWDGVRFKPALPASESCPVYSCHQDPGFYQEKREFRSGSIIPTVSDSEFNRLARHNGQPFGSLPGYQTNLGVVAVPTIPVGGYVYYPNAKKWVLFAEPRSSPPRYAASTARRTRQGGTTLSRRRKG